MWHITYKIYLLFSSTLTRFPAQWEPWAFLRVVWEKVPMMGLVLPDISTMSPGSMCRNTSVLVVALETSLSLFGAHFLCPRLYPHSILCASYWLHCGSLPLIGMSNPASISVSPGNWGPHFEAPSLVHNQCLDNIFEMYLVLDDTISSLTFWCHCLLDPSSLGQEDFYRSLWSIRCASSLPM